MWVVMGAILKVLEGFHHWSAQQIAGMMGRRMDYRELLYPPVLDALEAAGIWLIKEYIQIRQDTITA